MPQPFQRPSTQVKSWQCQKQSIIACFRDVGNRPCATDIIDMSHNVTQDKRTNQKHHYWTQCALSGLDMRCHYKYWIVNECKALTSDQ